MIRFISFISLLLASIAAQAANPVWAVAMGGDVHGPGVGPNSLTALMKAADKGAEMSLVSIARNADGTLVLDTPALDTPLAAALDSLASSPMLIVIANPADYVNDIQALAKAMSAQGRLWLYGMADPDAVLNYIAVVDLDARGAWGALNAALSLTPKVVELDFKSDDCKLLPAAIDLMQQASNARVMVNTAEQGKCGSRTDPKPREAEAVWQPLIDMGATVILTDQIKGLQRFLHP